MKKIMCMVLVAFSACGYSQKESEAIGQVKKLAKVTPIICAERVDVDISLGVMRNGVGSMSSQDVWLTVRDEKTMSVLKQANETGKLIRFKYDVARVNFCWEEKELIYAEIID